MTFKLTIKLGAKCWVYLIFHKNLKKSFFLEDSKFKNSHIILKFEECFEDLSKFAWDLSQWVKHGKLFFEVNQNETTGFFTPAIKVFFWRIKSNSLSARQVFVVYCERQKPPTKHVFNSLLTVLFTLSFYCRSTHNSLCCCSFTVEYRNLKYFPSISRFSDEKKLKSKNEIFMRQRNIYINEKIFVFLLFLAFI
jgi:hypothetical protein